MSNGGSSGSGQFLNLTTPWAFLSKEDGDLIILVQNVALGSFSILLWDIMDSVVLDYQLLLNVRTPNYMAIIYLASRLSALGFLGLCALNLTTAPANCATITKFMNAAISVSRACTGLLFYIRVKSLYSSNRLVPALLAASMLASVAGSILCFWTISAIRVGVPSGAPTSKYRGVCAFHTTAPYWLISLTPATEAIFDIVVCVAVTYKIQKYHDDPSRYQTNHYERSTKWRNWICRSRGRTFSRLADRFMRDSQIYAILALCIKIPEICFILIVPSIFPNTSGVTLLLGIPDIALTNILTTKIYRNMKLRRRGLTLHPFNGDTTMDPTFIGLSARYSRSIKFAEPPVADVCTASASEP